jgi:hypothetical protein
MLIMPNMMDAFCSSETLDQKSYLLIIPIQNLVVVGNQLATYRRLEKAHLYSLTVSPLEKQWLQQNLT